MGTWGKRTISIGSAATGPQRFRRGRKSMSMDHEIDFARAHLGPEAALTEIAGDASTRRFYRARGKSTTAVLIAHGQPLPPDAPFFSNHQIMESIGVPVPALLARSEAD